MFKDRKIVLGTFERLLSDDRVNNKLCNLTILGNWAKDNEATIIKALQAKEPEHVNMEIIKDIIYGFGWCNNAVEEINRLYPNGIIIKDGENEAI